MTLYPSVDNPVLVTPGNGKITVRMAPAAGIVGSDYQEWTLLNIGPHDATAYSYGYGVNAASAVIGGAFKDFCNFTGKAPSTFESAFWAVPAGQAWATGDWVGLWHGHIRRTTVAAYFNRGNPEMMAALVPNATIPCTAFTLDSTYDAFLTNGDKFATWRCIHYFGLYNGRWRMRVEQFWTPSGAAATVRTIYAAMLVTTCGNLAQGGTSPVITTAANNDAYLGNYNGSDFGPGVVDWKLSNSAAPNVAMRMSLALGNPGNNSVLQAGWSHVQDQADGADKVRALHTSYVESGPFTVPIRLLADYEMS